MNITKLSIIKSDERGVVYDCEKLNFVSRRKGSISGDHKHDSLDILYLVKGEFELITSKEKKTLSAPCKIEIEPGLHHTFVALTDVDFLEAKRDK
jgi:quercetin dioxygenase-like cupin family protein